MVASKEQCDLALEVLRRNGRRLPDADYQHLLRFLERCRGRLPFEETITRHAISRLGQTKESRVALDVEEGVE